MYVNDVYLLIGMEVSKVDLSEELSFNTIWCCSAFGGRKDLLRLSLSEELF